MVLKILDITACHSCDLTSNFEVKSTMPVQYEQTCWNGEATEREGASIRRKKESRGGGVTYPRYAKSAATPKNSDTAIWLAE